MNPTTPFSRPTFTSARDLINSCGLHATGTGKIFWAVCPVHGKPGSDRNLAIREYDGKIFLKCWSHECSIDSILSALNLTYADLNLREKFSTDRWQAPKPQPKFTRIDVHQPSRPAYTNLADYAAHSTPNPVPVEAYLRAGWKDSVFTTESGKEIPQITIPMADGKFKFRNLSGIGGKYINGAGLNTKTWYGLNRAIRLAQKNDSRRVIHCNGESSVVVAQFYGIPAFCGLTGESSLPSSEMIQELKAAKVEVEILLDNDDTGKAGAQALKNIYQKHGVPVVVRRFLDDLPQGFDLRDFCTTFQMTANPQEELNQAAPIFESKEDRAWFDTAQFKFTMAFLSQLGVKPAVRMTILYILAILNGRNSGPVSNFRLGQFTGQMSEADFQDLKADRESNQFINAKITVSKRGKRLWQAIELFQTKTGIKLITRTPGGPNSEGRLVSSEIRLLFFPAMAAAIKMIENSSLKWEERELELSRAARELANIEQISAKPSPVQVMTTEQKDWAKLRKFIHFVQKRVDDGRWTAEMLNTLYSEVFDLNQRFSAVNPLQEEVTETEAASGFCAADEVDGFDDLSDPDDPNDPNDPNSFGDDGFEHRASFDSGIEPDFAPVFAPDSDSGHVAVFSSGFELNNLSPGSQDIYRERKTNGFDDASPLPITEAVSATAPSGDAQHVPHRREDGVPVEHEHISFLGKGFQHGGPVEISNTEENRGDVSGPSNPNQTGILDIPEQNSGDRFEAGFSAGFGDIGRSLLDSDQAVDAIDQEMSAVQYAASDELTADDLELSYRGPEDDESDSGDDGDLSFDFADEPSPKPVTSSVPVVPVAPVFPGAPAVSAAHVSDDDEELNAAEIFGEVRFPAKRNPILAAAPDPVALLSAAFASPASPTSSAPTNAKKIEIQPEFEKTEKNGPNRVQKCTLLNDAFDGNKELTESAIFNKVAILKMKVLEIIGSSVHFELRKLEDALDIPPDVFLHDLEFIAEEPPETRRSFAAKRFSLMLNTLRTTKWDTYYCIEANRKAVQDVFGGAIRTLLKRLPELEAASKASETNGKGLRLVAGDLLDRVMEPVGGG